MKQVYIYMMLCGSYHMVAGPILPKDFGGVIICENPLPSLKEGEDAELSGIMVPTPLSESETTEKGGDKNVS
jgi:hypothetical protein